MRIRRRQHRCDKALPGYRVMWSNGKWWYLSDLGKSRWVGNYCPFCHRPLVGGKGAAVVTYKG